MASSVCLVGASYAYPEWVTEIWQDGNGGMSIWQKTLVAESQRHIQLVHQSNHLHQRVQLRNNVMEDLVHEQITPLDAINAFMEINQSCSTTNEMIRYAFEGHTEEERVANQLIELLTQKYPSSPEGNCRNR